MEEKKWFLQLYEDENAKDIAVSLADVSISAFVDVISGFPVFNLFASGKKLVGNISDYYFFKKVGNFLLEAESIPSEQKYKFIGELDSDNKMLEKICDYIPSLLARIDTDTKAKIIGILFKERVYATISTEQFARLCFVIENIYVDDLKQLPDFVEEKMVNDMTTNSLYINGLLTNKGIGWGNAETEGTYVFELNENGKVLFDILTRYNILQQL